MEAISPHRVGRHISGTAGRGTSLKVARRQSDVAVVANSSIPKRPARGNIKATTMNTRGVSQGR